MFFAEIYVDVMKEPIARKSTNLITWKEPKIEETWDEMYGMTTLLNNLFLWKILGFNSKSLIYAHP